MWSEPTTTKRLMLYVETQKPPSPLSTKPPLQKSIKIKNSVFKSPTFLGQILKTKFSIFYLLINGAKIMFLLTLHLFFCFKLLDSYKLFFMTTV